MNILAEPSWLALALSACVLILSLLVLLLNRSRQHSHERSHALTEQLAQILTTLEHGNKAHGQQTDQLRQLLLDQLQRAGSQSHADLNRLSDRFGDLRTALEHRVGDMQGQMLERLASGTQAMNQAVSAALTRSAEQIGQQVEKLTATTDKRLEDISGKVDERLKQGFEKTTATFTEVVKRLALIDAAQQRITELSSNVANLQEILADKRSRGAFGEIQLEVLVKNAMPHQHVSLQHALSNGTRVDCLLRLPPPTGDICIDAKFPLENFQAMSDPQLADKDRLDASRRFKQDIKKHLNDIAGKYIVPGETAVGAIMFLPAESIFAEIHAHHGELVTLAHDASVWICSPSTLMAVLTTARAVLRDDALRKQTGLLRQYLLELNTEFERFRERMSKLSRHIESAHEETRKVHITAEKISKRFAAIEQVHDEKALALGDVED